MRKNDKAVYTGQNLTREAWLLKLALLMKPQIEGLASLTLPPFRVTCGFPSQGGMMGGKTRVRGQCWSAEASEDGHAEIFISPVEDAIDTVAPILAHELIHAALPKAGHNRTFQAVAGKIGHEAPFTTAVPTPAFWDWANPLLATLPGYPHRKLNARKAVAAKKPQTNRQMKVVCGSCGTIARMSRKAIEHPGPPHCACGAGPMTPELPDETKG